MLDHADGSRLIRSSRPPRVVIVGAGTIGCYLGGRLHGAADITLIGRSRIGDAVAAHGLQVSDYLGYRKYVSGADVIYKTDMAPVADADVVFVTVKSGATVDAAREIGAVLARPALIVSFQNGLRNAELLRRHLPGHHIVAGMVPFNVVQIGPASFHQGSSGILMVDRDARLAPLLHAFADAGLTLTERDDMPSVQQAKLLLNLNNAINALSGVPLREELSQRSWRRCLALAQREALQIFAAVGMHPSRLTPLPTRWFPAVLELPDKLFKFLAARMLAIDPHARSSMWEDLQLGRRTEIQVIQGEIVALGAGVGRKAPVNARLIELIHAAEEKRASLTGEQLLTTLRQAAR